MGQSHACRRQRPAVVRARRGARPVQALLARGGPRLLPQQHAGVLPAQFLALPDGTLARARLPRASRVPHLRQAAALHGVLLRALACQHRPHRARVRRQRRRAHALPARAHPARGASRRAATGGADAAVAAQALQALPARDHHDAGAGGAARTGRALPHPHAGDDGRLQGQLPAGAAHGHHLVLRAQHDDGGRGLPARGHVPPEPGRTRLLRRARHSAARALDGRGDGAQGARAHAPAARAPQVATRAQPRARLHRRGGEEPLPGGRGDGGALYAQLGVEGRDGGDQDQREAPARAAVRESGRLHRVDVRCARCALADRHVHAELRRVRCHRYRVRLGLQVQAARAPGLRRRGRHRRGRDGAALGGRAQLHQRDQPVGEDVGASVAHSDAERADRQVHGARDGGLGGQVQADAAQPHPRRQRGRGADEHGGRAGRALLLRRTGLGEPRAWHDSHGRAPQVGPLHARRELELHQGPLTIGR
mmetsp:Transcript_48266/g.110858  ORF Transcript_48266/g.110858 Transcript_48266/m.110858 type:complete len:480 (-) Transcript_48266:130-1569(-)